MSYKFFLFVCALNVFYYVPNLLASPVIGGDEDTFNTHKYHVSIQNMPNRRNLDSGNHKCGGAIIHDRYILTAAHCFMTKIDGHIENVFQPRTSGFVVVAGTSETHGPGIIRDVHKIFIPHAYNRQEQNLYGDIAVLELSVDLYVEQNYDRLEILLLDRGHPFNVYENQNALFSGNGGDLVERGQDELLYPQNRAAEIRHDLVVYMLPRSQCLHYFDHFICALSLDRSQIRVSSFGDSGSPLVYGNTIIGVLSQGPGMLREGRLNLMLFTRVSMFINFIENAMNEHGDQTLMYTLDH